MDATELMFNLCAIFAGEGMVLYDSSRRCAVGNPDLLLRSRRLSESRRLPLDVLERLVVSSAAVEAGIMAYNIQLLASAMGLGGWMFSGMNPGTVLGALPGRT